MVFVALTAAVLAVVAIGVGAVGGLPPGSGMSGRSPIAQELDQYAVNLAANEGNRHPTTLIWAATNEGAAMSLAECGSEPANPTPAYYLVVEGGIFIEGETRGPPGHTSPTGPVAITILHRPDLSPLGGGVDLRSGECDTYVAQLGGPERDSLVGITPISWTRFDEKHHL